MKRLSELNIVWPRLNKHLIIVLRVPGCWRPPQARKCIHIIIVTLQVTISNSTDLYDAYVKKYIYIINGLFYNIKQPDGHTYYCIMHFNVYYAC